MHVCMAFLDRELEITQTVASLFLSIYAYDGQESEKKKARRRSVKFH